MATTPNRASSFFKAVNSEEYWVRDHLVRGGDVVNDSTVTGATVKDALENISGGGVGPVLTLNGQVGATQTFSAGSTGTDFAITSAALNHAFTIPNAGVGINRGLVTNSAQTIDGAKTFNNAPVLSTNTLVGGANTMTFPASAQTLVGRTTTDTLTGKTLAAGSGNDVTAIKLYDGFNTMPIAGGPAVLGDVLTATGPSGCEWSPPAVPAAITSINGLTPAAQTIAVGSAGTDFAVSSATSTHTLNLPTAGSGIARGLVTNGSQTLYGAKTFNDATTFTAAPVLSTNTLVGGANTMTLPASAQTLVGQTSTDALTNKTLAAGSGNDVTAIKLYDGANTVTIQGGAASANDVLTATSATTAEWSPPPVTAAITSINGLTPAAQTIAVGSAGTDFAVSSATSTHTLNLPSAGVGIARGLVTNGVQTIDGAKTFNSAATFSAAPVLSTNTLVGGANAMTFPSSAQTLVGLTSTDALTNKTLAKATNTVTASFLATTGADVNVVSAGPPTIGQVLMATAATTATWQTPAGGATTLDGLTDVAITTPAARDLLSYDGAGWINRTVPVALAGAGSNSVLIGASSVAPGTNNIVIGATAGSASMGASNIAIGANTLNSLTGAQTDNIAIGVGALSANFTTNGAIGIGTSALAAYTALAQPSVAIGNNAFSAATTANASVVIGTAAATTHTNGAQVVYVGYAAAPVSNGNYNVGVGDSVFPSLTSGSYNTVIGTQAGSTVTTGSYNSCFGYLARPDAIGRSGCVILGAQAASTADNQLVIATNNGADANTIRTTLACQNKGTSSGTNPANTDYLTVSVFVSGGIGRVLRYIPLYTTA